MTNDIVTRLKELAIEERPLLWRSAMFESANEIKRLQEENNTFKMKVHELYTEVERLSREVSRG